LTPTEFFKKLTGRYLWGNIFAMCIFVVMLVVAAQIGLNYYTHHGESIAVPNLRNIPIENAINVAEELDLVIVVSDTGYIKTVAPGTVLEQIPAAGTLVKSGRTIYLTINAINTPTVTLPDIIDNSSYREAIAKLRAKGFKIGEPQYIPGEKDWVYGVLLNGRSVVSGQRLPIEATLTIQVGNGQRDASDSIYVTDLPHDEYEDVSLYGDDFEGSESGTENDKKAEASESEGHTSTGSSAPQNGDDFEIVE
jgi:beta-lactam-binding protein with PASTA domain